MAEIITQTTRINAEYGIRPSAPSDVVALRYRLQPADVPERRSAVVRTVVGQGVETMTPVLHFAGLTKPLVLDAANAAALSNLAGSPLFGDWVGCLVELQVVTEAGMARIRLGRVPAPAVSAARDSQRPMLPVIRRNYGGALLIVAMLLLALAAVYFVDHWAEVQALLVP